MGFSFGNEGLGTWFEMVARWKLMWGEEGEEVNDDGFFFLFFSFSLGKVVMRLKGFHISLEGESRGVYFKRSLKSVNSLILL